MCRSIIIMDPGDTRRALDYNYFVQLMSLFCIYLIPLLKWRRYHDAKTYDVGTLNFQNFV